MITIKILDSIFHKLVVAVLITFVTFVIFAGIYFAVTKTIATAQYYCNFLYHNIVLSDIFKLQRVQKCLARVVTRSPRFSHSVQLLESLHWLPVRYRIVLKICTITKHFHPSNCQLAYLHSLLTLTRQPRQLRSFCSDLLFVPTVKTSVGSRDFLAAAPTLWNSLPVSVKSVGTHSLLVLSLYKHTPC